MSTECPEGEAKHSGVSDVLCVWSFSNRDDCSDNCLEDLGGTALVLSLVLRREQLLGSWLGRSGPEQEVQEPAPSEPPLNSDRPEEPLAGP